MTHDTPRVAFVTMARDEPRFLPVWLSHYRRHAGAPQDRIVLFDGRDQTPPDGHEDATYIPLPRAHDSRDWDAARWRMLSDLSAALLARYDVVVVGDVDELLVVDPAAGVSLTEAIVDEAKGRVASAFAIEVVHRIDLESPLDWSRPILGQRRYGRVNLSYCKPCMIGTPTVLSPGGHYATFPRSPLSERITLFHLRFADADYLAERQQARRRFIAEARAQGHDEAAGHGWTLPAVSMDDFMQSFVDLGPPQVTDFRFDWQRRRLTKSWTFDAEFGFWRHQGLHNRKTYTIPDRFFGTF